MLFFLFFFKSFFLLLLFVLLTLRLEIKQGSDGTHEVPRTGAIERLVQPVPMN
jgi:hypothetical protein